MKLTVLVVAICFAITGTTTSKTSVEDAAAQSELRAVAAFDLACGQDGIELQLLAGHWAGEGTQAGVTGCGQSRRYVSLAGAGWVHNTADRLGTADLASN